MIDEKKLIEEIRAAINDGRYDGYKPAAVLYEVWDMIKEQPKVGEWILCSERLPKNLVAVNVMWVNREPEGYYEHIKDKPFVDTAMRFKGKWYWWSSPLKGYLCEYGEYHYDLIDDAIDIIAWQPLPEPWEEEGL